MPKNKLTLVVSGSFIAVIIVLITAVLLISKQNFTAVRKLDAIPRVITLDESKASAELTGGFSIDTSGDQGCLANCPAPALIVWAQFGRTRLEQSIRNCKQVGHGDPYLDGADCDGERLYLKKVSNQIHVINTNEETLFILEP